MTGVDVVLVVAAASVRFGNGYVVVLLVRTGPFHRDRGADRRLGGGGHCCRRQLRDRLGLRFGSAHFLERRRELIGIGGGEELAARILGKALQLRPRVLFGHVEANDMGGEIDPKPLEIGADGAWVVVAGFDPVGDEDDGGLALFVFQFFRCQLYGPRQGRHAFGRYRGNRVTDGAAAARFGWNERFDVVAIALLAVAVGGEAELQLFGQGVEQAADDLACDLDLGDALDLAPHGA